MSNVQPSKLQSKLAPAMSGSSMSSRLGFSSSSTHDSGIDSKSPAGRRLQKEMMAIVKSPPPGIKMHPDTLDGTNLAVWRVEVTGPADTLYDGEEFVLQFKFGPRYPFESPEVTFVGEKVPVHEHIYSNGHICLSILSEDWSPALSVETVCLSITSMLSTAKEKKLPDDNALYVRTCSKNPKKTSWWFHDDQVWFTIKTPITPRTADSQDCSTCHNNKIHKQEDECETDESWSLQVQTQWDGLYL